MFYEFLDEVVSVEPEELSSCALTAGYIRLNELEKISIILDLPAVSVAKCRADEAHFHSDVEEFGNCFFATLRIINGSFRSIDSDRIAFYVTRNMLIVVDIFDRDCSVRDKFLSAIHRFNPGEVGIERLTYAFLESIISGDNMFLEDTEMYISRLEQQVIDDEAGENFNLKLLATKQLLLRMHNYYEHLLDISEALRDGNESIFDEREVRYFDMFGERVRRLRENVEMLRDSVIHLRDAYQSALELKLNQTMKIFTVFTVIFSPLTLITGWYGMNFENMPELKWKYGYFIVIGISAALLMLLLLLFKRKKWI